MPTSWNIVAVSQSSLDRCGGDRQTRWNRRRSRRPTMASQPAVSCLVPSLAAG